MYDVDMRFFQYKRIYLTFFIDYTKFCLDEKCFTIINQATLMLILYELTCREDLAFKALAYWWCQYLKDPIRIWGLIKGNS